MMGVQEIKLDAILGPRWFINKKIKEIADTVGGGQAICALSGGVDSSTVTMLGHRALGDCLKTYFIDNGLMREGEPEQVISLFSKLGISVELVDAREAFFKALKDVTDSEEKREAITQTFYHDVFARLVRESGARYLLQGTNLTDVEETAAGIKRQHNVFEQIGIDPQEAFGYGIIEPLVQLRKSGIRLVAIALGLPKEIWNRPPFPGPALAARITGEVVPWKVEVVRKATSIVEEILVPAGAFQYLAILHEDRVTGVRDGKRELGLQIEVRCWDSTDARSGFPTPLGHNILLALSRRITSEVPGVVSVTYNITEKPPSTIEAI